MKKKLLRCILQLNLLLCPVVAFSQIAGESPNPQPMAERTGQARWAKCLPTGITPSDVVEAGNAVKGRGRPLKASVTVENKLSDLHATCNGSNKLVDGDGREIVFYHLIGCWGNPPADYQELLQKQRAEIERLKQQYNVIEMTCNPSGAQIN